MDDDYENQGDIHPPPDDDHEIYNEEEERKDEELINRFQPDCQILLEEIKRKAQKYGFKERVPQMDNFSFPRKNDRMNVSTSQESIASEFFEKRISPKNTESWKKYKFFDFHVIVPKFISLGKYWVS